MTSFYPGPSQVYKDIPKYVNEAYQKGILGVNHRSEEFMQLYSDTVSMLKEKLYVPDDYQVYFTSSSTECWEIIAQSLINTTSYHFYNGAFGEKWFKYTQKIHPTCIGYRFNIDAELKIKDMDLSDKDVVICVTQNETSNGTQVSNKRIRSIRKQYPEQLIAVDATSSLAGVKLDIQAADIWYASVQKCFGLPAGMSVLICSPKAVRKAISIGEDDHYNSLSFIIEKGNDNQTTYTPNVLNIYLLNKVLSSCKPIDKIDKKLKRRYKKIFACIEGLSNFEMLIPNKKVRSLTVLPVRGAPEAIAQIKEEAKNHGILLGNGYGDLKLNTFRIANFPALRNKEVNQLLSFMSERK